MIVLDHWVLCNHRKYFGFDRCGAFMAETIAGEQLPGSIPIEVCGRGAGVLAPHSHAGESLAEFARKVNEL